MHNSDQMASAKPVLLDQHRAPDDTFYEHASTLSTSYNFVFCSVLVIIWIFESKHNKHKCEHIVRNILLNLPDDVTNMLQPET